jgi:hypothetical protein
MFGKQMAPGVTRAHKNPPEKMCIAPPCNAVTCTFTVPLPVLSGCSLPVAVFNRLPRLPAPEVLLVTLNPPKDVRP